MIVFTEKQSVGPTYRTLVMTHVNVTLEIQSWTSSETESFEVRIQRDLMSVVRIVRPSERTDQLFVGDTSVETIGREAGKDQSGSLVRCHRGLALFPSREHFKAACEKRRVTR